MSPLIVAETGHSYPLFTSIEARKPAQLATDPTEDIVTLQSAYDEHHLRDLPKHGRLDHIGDLLSPGPEQNQ